MAQEKTYPGGFELTRKTAETLAVQELGTARGLEPEPGMPEGCFHMMFGNLEARIRPDTYSMSGRILLTVGMNCVADGIVQFHDRETLEPDYDTMEKYVSQEKHKTLEQWVYGGGPEPCHKLIDEIWNRVPRK